jgi:signal transduction histidine kinase
VNAFSTIAFGMGAIAGGSWLLQVVYVRRMLAGYRQQSAARLLEQAQHSNAQIESLLQDLQGILYRFQAVADSLPTAEPTRATMLRALDFADELMAGARDRIRGFKLLKSAEGSLDELLMRVAENWARQTGKHFTASFRGPAPVLQRSAREALVQIGEEALSNAFRHSLATHVELDLVYDVPRRLILRVRDDGRGLDASHEKAGQGHVRLGLIGIQERARWLDTQAEIWSGPNAGTEISICVSGERAYLDLPQSGSRAWLANRIAALRASD